MQDDAIGPWDPLDLGQVVRLFERWPSRWWITGGMALELYLGRSWRTHDDSDVSILRTDASGLPALLPGWDVQVAAAGSLTAWDRTELSAEANQNNVWCRKAPNRPWCLDVTLSEGDQDCWIYRRDAALQVPWAAAVLTTADGVPYLDPVLQLLFKSKNTRSKDDRDAREVVPALRRDQRHRLRGLLPSDHPWQRLLASQIDVP